MKYPAIAKLRTRKQFNGHLSQLPEQLKFELTERINPAIFEEPITLLNGFIIENRFCIHPMEGWDGTKDGKPTEHTIRRWRNFGKSGAKLIWGGEAVAVMHEGRANPNQLLLNEENAPEIEKLLDELKSAHEEAGFSTKGLYVGLQLTHSGRFARPNLNTKLEPKILYHHPYLDKKFDISPSDAILTDEEIKDIIQHFIDTAILAEKIGFDFVDVKHCHGYLGHEFLTAREPYGKYRGSFENRTRFLREIVMGIREHTDLDIGVRLSGFDLIAFTPAANTHVGRPVEENDYPQPFGADKSDPQTVNLSETKQFLSLLQELEIQLVNITAGSPYYNPHIQRPAMFPPSDGYKPPEDPLAGVIRQVNVVKELKNEYPDLIFVGTGYTYLQEWLALVAQSALLTNSVDFIGLGRMVLSYPEYPADIIAGKSLDKRKLCRTFSDCTTAPRCGLISGCFPLDHYYKDLPEYVELKEKKKTT
jgi:NADPH2 dehydrogenase